MAITKTKWWRCPNCGGVNEKSLPPDSIATASCMGCHKFIQDAYSGKYDVEHLGGNNFKYAPHNVEREKEMDKMVDNFIREVTHGEKKWWQIWRRH